VGGGDFIGPSGPFELRGPPKPARASARARNEADAARLWEISESLTGERFALP
jgi:hypothetical protein